MGLYSWGYNAFGQLALQDTLPIGNSDEIDENNRTTPTQVQFDISQKAWKVAPGWRHTIIITFDGTPYSCGDNGFGQLGRNDTASTALLPVPNLNKEKIISSSCGESHSLFLNDKGQVFACGQNDYGQLGVGSHKESYSAPLLVERISIDFEVTAICCGQDYSMALTSGGQIFSWGDNRHGQLGIGNKSPKETKPCLIVSLKGCPINHICAGGSHSFALSISGKLFSWGKNSCGQLGLGNTDDQVFPTRVKISLQQNEFIRYVTCGEEHSALLTSGGKVLTFGNGSSGQLGHHSFDNEIVPRIVIDMLDSGIASLTCGRKHTMCYSSLNGHVYAFGINVKGQLGISHYKKMNNATKIGPRHWKTFDRTDYVNVSSEEKNVYFETQLDEFMNELNDATTSNGGGSNEAYTELFTEIVAGGLSSFLLTSPIEKPRLPDFHNLQKKNKLSMLTQSQLDKMSTILQNTLVDRVEYLKIQHYLTRAFSSQSCMNASFLSLKSHETTSRNEHGLHLMGIHVSIEKLWKIKMCRDIMKHCVRYALLPSLHSNPADIECLRTYVILPEIFVLMDSVEIVSVALLLAVSINQLQLAAHKILVSWWKVFPPTFLERIVKCYKSTILELFPKQRSDGFRQVTVSNLEVCLKVLKIIFEICEEDEMEKLTHTTFSIPDLMEKIDIHKDYVNWIENPDRFSFCHYPFIFEIKEKSLILEYDADLQMKMMVGRAHMMNLTNIVGGNFQPPQNPFLVVHIRRDHLVQDTLNNILAQQMVDFKKPLKVRFADEDAEDAGGVKKEFFLLLMKDLLDPNYGMFEFFGETGNMWFKSGSFEGPEMFMLIGVICGLAIYNSIIVDMPFPLCLYKKLLDRKVTLEDYRDLDPNVYRQIQDMLDYVGDDFSDIYDLTFQVTETVFGTNVVYDLKENGSEIIVTQENKQDYVNCFIDYKFNRSVERHFLAFKDGFLRVCGSQVLHFLHPRELMELVVGSQDYDFADLEKVTEYKGEYYRQHHVIVNFWDVFYDLDLDMKKKFLAFLTGTNKVSVLGIKYMKFIIQPVAGGEDGEHLPVAHTCFNLLDLPRYPDLDTMRRKIHQAIENSEGFGLV